MSLRRLPIFPLGVVLLPGATRALHIFEPRYRQMLADVVASDGRFVLALLPPGTPERGLPTGWPSTIAEVVERTPLPDGRLDIVVRGEERVTLNRFVDDPAPYHVIEYAAAPDEPLGATAMSDVTAAAERVRSLFARIVGAAQTISERTDDALVLPDDPSLVAYVAAAHLDFDLAAQHELLAMSDPRARLVRVADRLARAVEDLETRAAVHTRAKTNGHGPH